MKLTWQYDKENWLNNEQILLLTLEKVYVKQFSAANHLLVHKSASLSYTRAITHMV